MADAVAAVSGSDAPAESGTASAGTVRTAASPPRARIHTVRRGESLWQIAHRYSVNVAQLQRWNHLHGHALRPGMVLRLSDAE